VQSALPGKKLKITPSRRQLLIVAAVAGMFPDMDYASILIDSLSFIADWHRGPTHSIVMIPIWSVLLGWLFSRTTRHRAHFSLFTLIAAAALLTHILSDTITPWGTQILWPLSDYRVTLGTSFVIDPIMTALVLCTLLTSLYWSQKRIALLGMTTLITYISMQAIIKHQVETLAENYAIHQGIENAHITSLPQPFAPFNWTLIIRDGNSYHLARTNILLSVPFNLVEVSNGMLQTLMYSYRPSDQLQWQLFYQFGNRPETAAFSKAAWQQAEFTRFRRFAQLPVLFKTETTDQQNCSWFADLRYILPIGTPPFVYGMCQDYKGRWHLKRGYKSKTT